MHIKQKVTMLVMIVLFVVVIVGLLIVVNSKEDKNKPEFIYSSEKTHNVSVIFINAGKADSILVQADDNSYLIDTGLSSSVPMIQNVLLKYNVNRLNGVFITHSHKDHLGGLKKISKVYDIDSLYCANISEKDSNSEKTIEESAKKNELNLTELSAGDKVEIAEELYFEVVAPLEYNHNDDNDNSLVLRLYVNGKVFLFTGDMQFAEETTLLNAGIDVSADILKVGNHGNPDATSDEFAKAVSPEIAIITTDTSEDEDSANERVRKLFENIYITQDYHYGIKVMVDKDGSISVDEA